MTGDGLADNDSNHKQRKELGAQRTDLGGAGGRRAALQVSVDPFPASTPASDSPFNGYYELMALQFSIGGGGNWLEQKKVQLEITVHWRSCSS